MKKSLLSVALSTIIASSALVSTQATAVEGLSANISVTSNYLWRGISQTSDAAAVSGGIDYAADNGFYAGTWVSNVDFGDSASYEVDFYAGFGGEFGDGFGYDVGYIYYGYPDSAEIDPDNEYDFGEVYGTLSYGAFSISANYGLHAQSVAVVAEDALYISADAAFEIADGLELALHIGNYSFDAKDAEDYTDYGVSLSKSGFTIGVSDTELTDDDMKVYVSYSIDFDL
ncbi:hypothetical protein LP316_02375 [Thalassotalea sp. LPB0316]|uniref:TorF family putative porin n=1 Tax=Thalassotalea sp. LPB0316 TaxID=2769490 RepID=UPI00186898E3|nr:TorF family putative porin [Thalassotalea sp. LPB0316]QOL26169.1 hypothetical protein LP316_02375 [Thalassotalea sp. LPB0316]